MTLCFQLLLATSLYADSGKIITLKDGSVLKGQLVKFENGTYTLATENLGEIRVPEANVLSIASSEALSPGQTIPGNPLSQNNSQLKGQVEQMKGKMLADPALMQDVQHLMEDQNVQEILSDPQLIKDVLSYDQDKIMQNPKILQLMNNPQMKQLMHKAAESHTPAP